MLLYSVGKFPFRLPSLGTFPMGHNPQSSPAAMPAPFQGAYRKLEFQYIIISSLKGKVAASFASRRKGCDTGNCDTPLRLDKLGTSPQGEAFFVACGFVQKNT